MLSRGRQLAMAVIVEGGRLSARDGDLRVMKERRLVTQFGLRD